MVVGYVEYGDVCEVDFIYVLYDEVMNIRIEFVMFDVVFDFFECDCFEVFDYSFYKVWICGLGVYCDIDEELKVVLG